MKFAIKYYQGCRVLTKADEIIIRYTEKKSYLIEFVKKWGSDTRIIVDITELSSIEENMEIFHEAWKQHCNIAFIINRNQSPIELSEYNMDYFYIEGVNSYDDLTAQVEMGVSDVYIMNEMGFNLEKISQYCHNNNVKVRVYPNVAQSSSNFMINNFKKFFIRPDDVKLYEDYVDIFEFFGPLDRQSVLYEIYYDERWLGDLNRIILGLDKEINNQTIMPYFGLTRVSCNKRCNMGKCDICGTIELVGKTLEEKEIGLTRRKAKHNEYIFNEETMSNEPAAIISAIGKVSEET